MTTRIPRKRMYAYCIMQLCRRLEQEVLRRNRKTIYIYIYNSRRKRRRNTYYERKTYAGREERSGSGGRCSWRHRGGGLANSSILGWPIALGGGPWRRGSAAAHVGPPARRIHDVGGAWARWRAATDRRPDGGDDDGRRRVQTTTTAITRDRAAETSRTPPPPPSPFFG